MISWGWYSPLHIGDYFYCNNPIEESQTKPTRIQWNEGFWTLLQHECSRSDKWRNVISYCQKKIMWIMFCPGSFKVSRALLICVISCTSPNTDLPCRGDNASKVYRTTGRAFVHRDCIVWPEPPLSFQIPLATWSQWRWEKRMSSTYGELHEPKWGPNHHI